MNGLVVPVRTLYEPHGDDAPGALGPIHHAARIIRRTAQVCLHGKSGLKVHCLAATLEELNGEVLERKLLHVKVDKYPMLLGTFKNRHDFRHQRANGTLGIDWVNASAERTDLDADIRPWNWTKVIGFQH